MSRTFAPRRGLTILILIAAVAAMGCNDATAPLPPLTDLFVSASLQGTLIDTVVVTVTAPDIPQPLVFNLGIANRVAQGTISVRAGSARTITVQAFDQSGIETHNGSTTVDVHPGTNLPISLLLTPLTGDQPVTVGIGALTLAITPRVWTMARGQSVVLRGTILDGQGVAVPGQLVWGSTNPGRATVTLLGGRGTIRDSARVTDGPSHGVVEIVASYGGVAATTSVFLLGPVSAGSRHTCGIADLTGSFTTICWGRNDAGQIGDTPNPNPNGPIAVTGQPALAAITGGDRHTCGIVTSGGAQCWGSNAFGQLGDGSLTDSYSPVPAGGALTFASVEAGDNYTCGLTPAGVAHCWGENQYGQLGTGNQAGARTPVAVAGGLTFGVISAATGHTCGVTTGGTAYCWGLNFAGETGSGTPNPSNAPTPVAGGHTFTAITTGVFHTCGLTAAGAAWCWGDNTERQLGSGTTVALSAVPLAVAGTETFVAIAAGLWHTCALTADGHAYCWGLNANAQGGSGSTALNLDTPTAVAANLQFISITAGYGHTCAVTASGPAYCWGLADFLQTGDLNGNTGDRPTPVAVLGGTWLFP